MGYASYLQKQSEKKERFSKVSIATLETMLNFDSVYDIIITFKDAKRSYRIPEKEN